MFPASVTSIAEIFFTEIRIVSITLLSAVKMLFQPSIDRNCNIFSPFFMK